MIMKPQSASSVHFHSLSLFSLVFMFSIVMLDQRVVAQNKDHFTLTIELQSPINSNFKVCVPVRVNETFRVTWMNHKAKNSISGILRPSIRDEYPLELSVLEAEGNNRLD